MGGAAYRRGSLAISRQYCAERGCRGCASCGEWKPTPRPAEWGDKTKALAVERAASLLRGCRLAGHDLPCVDLLAAMVGVDRLWSQEACKHGAEAALAQM